jgi:hypothetical protein
VDAVIGAELSAELSIGGDYGHLPILQDVSHADSALKQLLSPRLLAALRMWPSRFSEESGPRWAHQLDQCSVS